MFRTLSVIVTSTRDDPVLAAAIAVAEREGAFLSISCLGIEPAAFMTMPMEGAVMTAGLGMAEAREEANELASRVRARLPIDLRAEVEPVSVSVLSLTSMAARLARFSDMVFMRPLYGGGIERPVSLIGEGLLFGAFGPFLVVPEEDRTDWRRPFGRICLAWDDSDEALRAARAALPLLRAAQAVDVVMVDPPAYESDWSDPTRALALWLSRHDVRSEVSLIPRTRPRIADVLTGFCRERGCEALVMGAYGHSRLREAILGGTTRAMLTSAPLPLIMAP